MKIENKGLKKIVLLILVLVVISTAIYALTYSGIVDFSNMQLNYETATTLVTSTTVAGQTATTIPGQTATTVVGAKTTTTVVGTGTFQPSQVTLEIKSWGFNPDYVTIMKDSTASWTNKDSKVHTVTSAGNFDSGDINAGETWTHTFDTAGNYQYTDSYSGFQATLVIE